VTLQFGPIRDRSEQIHLKSPPAPPIRPDVTGRLHSDVKAEEAFGPCTRRLGTTLEHLGTCAPHVSNIHGTLPRTLRCLFCPLHCSPCLALCDDSVQLTGPDLIGLNTALAVWVVCGGMHQWSSHIRRNCATNGSLQPAATLTLSLLRWCRYLHSRCAKATEIS
jgi:hypothetical protein